MFVKIANIFLVSLLVGCVTVNEQSNNNQFNKIKAAEARIKLGLSYLESKDMIRSRENLKKAISYAPDYYRSLIAMAHFYQEVGENEQAEQAYKKALEGAPKNGDVLNNYGTFLCKIGRFDEADVFFNRAIEQPYYYLIAASYQNAAMCALKSRDQDKAEHYFARSLDHDPNRTISILQLTQIEIQKAKYKKARVRLLKFHNRFGYKASSLGLLIELETQAKNDTLVSKYVNLLKDKYPDSIQYQKYVANEY